MYFCKTIRSLYLYLVYGGLLGGTEGFLYLGGFLTGVGDVTDETNLCMMIARAAYAIMGYLWNCRDVHLPFKGRVCNMPVRGV